MQPSNWKELAAKDASQVFFRLVGASIRARDSAELERARKRVKTLESVLDRYRVPRCPHCHQHVAKDDSVLMTPHCSIVGCKSRLRCYTWDGCDGSKRMFCFRCGNYCCETHYRDCNQCEDQGHCSGCLAWCRNCGKKYCPAAPHCVECTDD